MSREAMQLALEALEDANDVARMEFSDEDYYGEAITALRQALEEKQELPADGPVAWSCQCGRPYTVTCISSKPPKKEWIGLTDEEVNELVAQFKRYAYVLLREVEAKLKEKNHG